MLPLSLVKYGTFQNNGISHKCIMLPLLHVKHGTFQKTGSIPYSVAQELCIWSVHCRVFFYMVRYRLILSIFFRVTSLALGQSYDCPSANEAILKNMDKNFTRIHQKLWYNHNKTKHNEVMENNVPADDLGVWLRILTSHQHRWYCSNDLISSCYEEWFCDLHGLKISKNDTESQEWMQIPI